MFLLIFSYVIGSITGPGIWYTATAASPRGISALIHNFVWVWATEWIFFLFEVVGVFALVYFIGKVDRRTHLTLTYTFALASLGTLMLIIGIISFMMWPGTDAYYVTGSASDAFFGINTFPHMFLRIGFMVMLSGVIGLFISSALPDQKLRKELTRKLGMVSMLGGFLVLFFFMWYVSTLPESAEVLLEIYLPDIMATRIGLMIAFSIYFAVAILAPRMINKSLAGVMIAVILIVGIWPGEKLRESLRKPYVAGRYMYSNQIISRDVPGKGIKSEVEKLARVGFLKASPWVPERLKTITPENKLEVGELLTKRACSNCHSLEPTGKFRPLMQRIAGWDAQTIKIFMQSSLATGAITYMPKIDLPDEEFDAMATWMATQNQQGVQ